jgi:hypothetical protein
VINRRKASRAEGGKAEANALIASGSSQAI